MFGNENSMEPVQLSPARRAARAEGQPIREATQAEMPASGYSTYVQKSLPFKCAIQPQRSLPLPRQAASPAEPDAVAKQHGFYTADRWRTRHYYSDYQQKSEVMRASATRITTKLDDKQTVNAMLDVAEARGWQTLKLRGAEDFKREAWVQSQLRGIETDGYRPKATDVQEAERRKLAALPAAEPSRQAAPVRITAGPAANPAATIPKETAAAKAAPKETVKAKAASKPNRSREKAIWNAPEAAGQQLREQDAAKQAAKPVAAIAPKPAAEAA